MANTEHYLNSTDIHPIDIVENLAEHREWVFDRIADDQIAMAVEGSWRTYSLTLAWSPFDETLRMICNFEMEPPEARLPELYDVLNRTNDRCWTGAFSLWRKEGLMVYRYGLVLAGGASASTEQIEQLLSTAVATCERYYPAFQLACWGGASPRDAMEIAIAEGYGRA
jgi:hypothetical protein